MPSMILRMMSTSCSSVSRSTFQSTKHWLPGMSTGRSLMQALQFSRDAGKGFVAKGCDMMCHSLHSHHPVMVHTDTASHSKDVYSMAKTPALYLQDVCPSSGTIQQV